MQALLISLVGGYNGRMYYSPELHESDVDLTLYNEEVGRLGRELCESWRKMLFPESTEEDVYRRWGGQEEFLAIMGMYLIVEKGVDLEDERAVDDAFSELTDSTF